jgi:hypothetical protein
LAIVVPNEHSAARTHPKLSVERLKLRITEQIDHVQPAQPVEHSLHEFLPNPSMLMCRQYFEERNVGRKHTVSDGGDKADNRIPFRGNRKNDVVAAGQQA